MSFAQYTSGGEHHHVPARVTDAGSVINAGYDVAEGVQKVAMMTWNTSLLQWERGTITGGGTSTAAGPTTKRIDKASATILYVGSANVGTLESDSAWGIQKITFDANGNATASYYGVGIWQDRATLIYG